MVSIFFLSSFLALSRISAALAFSFSAATPTSCDDVKITWTGGSAPFTVLLTPVFGTPRNVSIPDSSFSNGKGSYTISQFPFSSGQRMMMTMSDSTGFGAGGNTDVLKVGASTGSTSCNTTDPGVAFPFQLNTALQQCRAYTFSDYTEAVQPVTIMGLIPNGDAFEMFPTKGDTTYDWIADVYNGTNIIFLMIDADGRQGGSSDLTTVGISDDSSCISSSSPSVTAEPSQSSATATSTSVASVTATQSSSSSSGSTTPLGAIAGTVVGALIFLAAIISFVLFYLKRKQDRKDAEWNSGPGGNNFGRHSRRLQSEVDLASSYDGHAPGSAFPFFPQGNRDNDSTHGSNMANASNVSINMSNINPFASPEDHSSAGVEPYTATTSETMTTQQRKAAMAGVSSYTPSRFVLHTDIDDALPPPNEEGVVELPPQYTERRGAPPSVTSTHDAPSYTPSTSSRQS